MAEKAERVKELSEQDAKKAREAAAAERQEFIKKLDAAIMAFNIYQSRNS